jgi:hypothetical protein
MQNMRKRSRQSGQGYVLLITVVFIGIALLLLGSVMNWTNSSAKQTERNNLFSMCAAAAEADTERVIAQMTRDFYNQTFNANSNYTPIYLAPSNQTGWPCQFTFSDGSGTNNQTGVSTTPYDYTTNWARLNAMNSSYSNLWAAVANCTVTSTATTTNQPYQVSATVQQKFQLASIPIFQFFGFYNLDMEVDPGQAMTIRGPVFSNKGIWARGLATFYSSVACVGTLNVTATDPYVSGKSDSTAATFNSTTNSNAATLNMPIGTNTSPEAVRAFLELPPTNITNPYSQEGQQYFYNKADIILSNAASGTNISAYYQGTNSVTFFPGDVIITNGPATNRTYLTNYSFATNVSFYDYREKKNVKAVQLNVSALNTWLTNNATGILYNGYKYTDKGQNISSVYIYNNATASSTNLPAVRVVNGAALPTPNGRNDGLTVVTPQPLYVMGHYNLNNGDATVGQTNTANTGPSALIGDSLTVLSSKWLDTWTSGTSLSTRNPTNTTINAATFEGIVCSTGSHYSGGVENFLRLLENWNNTSTTVTYNGSIVVMFSSHYATNFWDGTVYGVPIRKWAFDLNFMQQNKLPPITPQVRAVVPQSWKVY